jgi:hypothetical protein
MRQKFVLDAAYVCCWKMKNNSGEMRGWTLDRRQDRGEEERRSK